MNYDIAAQKNRSVGAFFGLAIGDDLGAHIQFKRRDAYEHVKGYTAGGTSPLEAAMWSVWKTDNFRDALILAVNLGDDADTVGAVAGQISGAIYGIDKIPPSWVSELVESSRMFELGSQLFDQRHKP